MKSSERYQENGAGERNVVATETLHITYHSTLSNKYSHPKNLAATKLTEEETLKIGRRYSFDDNGGGYQGL